MVIPSAGTIVLVPFPFSDLSQSKLRPAVVLTAAGRGDWILCQMTSNAYADTHAIVITNADLRAGGLRGTGYVRPGKLFTASRDLITAEIGQLQRARYAQIVEAVVRLLRAGLTRHYPTS